MQVTLYRDTDWSTSPFNATAAADAAAGDADAASDSATAEDTPSQQASCCEHKTMM